MKVAVWTSERSGPAAVFIAKAKAPADTAAIPGCPKGPFHQWAAKGLNVSWGKWIEHLADGLPRYGQWSVQEVPDGIGAREALALLREQQVDRHFSQD
jgi:hypothetical protein